jgi:predicted N-formylglutamate amidohydrolase
MHPEEGVMGQCRDGTVTGRNVGCDAGERQAADGLECARSAIEGRQDPIADDTGQRAWGMRLAHLLSQSCRNLVAAEALRPV